MVGSRYGWLIGVSRPVDFDALAHLLPNGKRDLLEYADIMRVYIILALKT